ncbi:hypothetical protein L9F63_021104, partial [Diploptera punctata]
DVGENCRSVHYLSSLCCQPHNKSQVATSLSTGRANGQSTPVSRVTSVTVRYR